MTEWARIIASLALLFLLINCVCLIGLLFGQYVIHRGEKSKLKGEIKFTLAMIAVMSSTFIITYFVAFVRNPCHWIGHDYEIVAHRDATCSKEGINEKECSRCGDAVSEVLPKTAHQLVAVKTIEATCSAPEIIVNKCTVCGTVQQEKIGTALAHTWEEIEISEATCSAPKTITKKCTVCSVIEIVTMGETLPHDLEKIAVEEATCTAPKTITYKCTVCGEVETEKVGKELSHKYGEWVEIKESTPSENGIRERTCERCGKKQSEKLTKLDHYTISAEDLFAAYDENEIAAEQKYSGQKVLVYGIVSDINGSDWLSDANVLLEVDSSLFGCVQCNFNSENEKALASIQKGDTVRIIGTCKDIGTFNVIISNCKIVK